MGKGKRLRSQRQQVFESNDNECYPALQENAYTGISTNWYFIIKYIAILSMLSDHLGKVLYAMGCLSVDALLYMTVFGRLAFPLFAFELVECFHFTKNRKQHLIELGLLALLSEFPFDMALIAKDVHQFRYGDVVDYSCLYAQNVCYTLFFSFLMLMIMDKFQVSVLKKYYKKEKTQKFVKTFGKLAVLVLFMIVCQLMDTDYAALGVFLVGFLEFARQRKHIRLWQGLAVFAFVFGTGHSFILNLPPILILTIIFMSERPVSQPQKTAKIFTSRVSKYVCRFFYPAHLLVLSLVRFFS